MATRSATRDVRWRVDAGYLDPASQLTDFERLALRNGVSEEFLECRGWREAEHGEIVTDKGRTVFDPGFATGIRKVLNE